MKGKRKKKIIVERWNPSSRKNERVEIAEIQSGVLKYKDLTDSFECLVAFETKSSKNWFNPQEVTIKEPRKISFIKWNISSGPYSVGDSISLSPRDIAILDAVLEYLKKQGYYIP